MPANRLDLLVAAAALAAASAAQAADPVKLPKDEVQKALAGKSLTYGGRSGAQIKVFFSADGNFSLRSLSGSRGSSGTWTVEDDGRFCVKVISGTAPDVCRHLLKTDDGYAMSNSRGTDIIPIEKME